MIDAVRVRVESSFIVWKSKNCVQRRSQGLEVSHFYAARASGTGKGEREREPHVENPFEGTDDDDSVQSVDGNSRHVPRPDIGRREGRARRDLKHFALEPRLHVVRDDLSRRTAHESKVSARRHRRHLGVVDIHFQLPPP